MKVFISWSGPQSRQIAEALRDWLPMAIQVVRPYMSQRDNEAGVRWEGKVSAELASSNFGILCLTPSNLESTWLNFEAGALGKVIDEARVVPLLYKLTPADVARPLGMFMAKALDEEGVKETLISMNNNIDADRRLEPVALDGAFTAMWPMLKEKLARIEDQDTSVEPERRDIRDITEEILELVRSPRLYPISPAADVFRDNFITERIHDVLGRDVLVEIIGDVVFLRNAPLPGSLTTPQRRQFREISKFLAAFGVDISIQSVKDIETRPLTEGEDTDL
jgi:TIR domain